MKEELRWGRTVGAAVEAGFSRAWTSILDSNLSTLITCAILILFGRNFGAQAVMGFAVTLAIGVAVSMFTAITVTHTLIRAVFERSSAEGLREKRWLLSYWNQRKTRRSEEMYQLVREATVVLPDLGADHCTWPDCDDLFYGDYRVAVQAVN